MFTFIAVTIAVLVIAGDRVARATALTVSFVAHLALLVFVAVLRLMAR